MSLECSTKVWDEDTKLKSWHRDGLSNPLENGRRWRIGKVPGLSPELREQSSILSNLCAPIPGLSVFACHLLPRLSPVSCHVMSAEHWANFLVCGQSQTWLPGSVTTAICWALMTFSWGHLHPLGATVLSPAELLMSWVLEVPEVHGMEVVYMGA